MENLNIKSVRFSAATNEKLEKVAVKLGRTKKLVIIQMVDYFYGSKKDPLDRNDELLKKELVNGIGRIIGFIRKQESDFLLPTFTTSESLNTITQGHTKYLQSLIDETASGGKKTDELSLRIGLLEKGVSKVQNSIDDKLKLKEKFSELLEYYITQRDLIGWANTNNKKEELQGKVRRLLEIL